MRVRVWSAAIAFSLTSIAAVAEDVAGGICIATLPEDVEEGDRLVFSGGPARRYRYEFAVMIDDRAAVAVPRKKPVFVGALERTRAHRVKILDGSQVIESFRFNFADRGGSPLCLSYTPGYQTWSLEKARPGQKWCDCPSPNEDLQQTERAPRTGPRH